MTALAEQLASQFEVSDVTVQNSGRVFTQVMLWPGEERAEEGAVYICAAGDLPEVPALNETCALVCLGPLPERYRRFNTVVLEPPPPLGAVVNALQRTFRQLREWSDRLYRSLYLEKGVQAIINETLRMFENPVYVHDKNYRIIAYAENSGLPGMDGQYGFLSYGRLSPKTIRALSKLPGFADTFDRTEPAYWQKTDSRVDTFSYLYGNLRLDGEYCGRIFVDERVRPIRRLDYVVMAELIRVVELALRRRNLFADSHLSQFGARLTELLEGTPVPRGVLEQELNDLGWGTGGPYFCFQLKLTKADVLFNTALSLCDLVESKLHDCQAFPYGEHILMVVNAGRWEERRGIFLRDFQPILSDFRLHAGISLMFPDLMDLRCYYEQTCIALAYGPARFPEQFLHYFDHYALDYILDHSMEHFTAEMLCPKPLLRLIAYDRDNHTHFSETLRAYLECDSSPARAMALLFIHRSTFLYRLGRIQEITGMDLEDPRLKLHLLLAFQLLERAEHREETT